MRSLLFIIPLLACAWAHHEMHHDHHDMHHVETKNLEGEIRQSRDVNRQLPAEANSNFDERGFRPARGADQQKNLESGFHQNLEEFGRQARHSDMHHVEDGVKTLEGGIRQRRGLGNGEAGMAHVEPKNLDGGIRQARHSDMHHDHHEMHHVETGVKTLEEGIRQRRDVNRQLPLEAKSNFNQGSRQTRELTNQDLHHISHTAEESGRQTRHSGLPSFEHRDLNNVDPGTKNLEGGIRQSRGIQAEQQNPLEERIRQARHSDMHHDHNEMHHNDAMSRGQ